MDPVLVHRDHPLHGGGVGEGEEEGLSEDLVDEVDIVSGAVEYLPDQSTLQVQVTHVVRLVERQAARLPGI